MPPTELKPPPRYTVDPIAVRALTLGRKNPVTGTSSEVASPVFTSNAARLRRLTPATLLNSPPAMMRVPTGATA